MDWNLDKKRPICPQICEQLCILIASGRLQAGERLLSVREVALDAGVTPNTVQKSFEQLEEKGVIFSRRGSGWYVSEDTDIARRLLDDLILRKTRGFIHDMKTLGLSGDKLINTVKENLYE